METNEVIQKYISDSKLNIDNFMRKMSIKKHLDC